jgi:hypothetical protein
MRLPLRTGAHHRSDRTAAAFIAKPRKRGETVAGRISVVSRALDGVASFREKFNNCHGLRRAGCSISPAHFRVANAKTNGDILLDWKAWTLCRMFAQVGLNLQTRLLLLYFSLPHDKVNLEVNNTLKLIIHDSSGPEPIRSKESSGQYIFVRVAEYRQLIASLRNVSHSCSLSSLDSGALVTSRRLRPLSLVGA